MNRIADVLERVNEEVDAISGDIFSRSLRQAYGAPGFPQRPGADRPVSGELVSKASESLVSLARLFGFVHQSGSAEIEANTRPRFRILARDVGAMSDHAAFLGDKVQFLLDATLGMVSIDQNNILKIFSVVTVFLLPPSVITGFYGMNFEHIPWLHARWGAWAAIALMVASALCPMRISEGRGWL